MLPRRPALLARALNAPRRKFLRSRRMAAPRSLSSDSLPAVGRRQHRKVRDDRAPATTSGAERAPPGSPTKSSVAPNIRSQSSGQPGLDALVNQPEVQALLRQAAERRSESPAQPSTGSGHGTSQSVNLSTNSRIRFTQSPPMMAPQVTAGRGADLPAQCLPPTGSGKASPRSHGKLDIQQGSYRSGSVNDPGNSEAPSSRSPKNNSKEEDLPSEDPPQNTIPLPEDHDGAMSKTDYLNDPEHDEESGQESAVSENEEQEVHIPMSFQIPEDVMRAAMSASPNSAGGYYNQNMYHGPEGQQLSIHYCHNMEITKRVLPYFLEETVLGFDIEWKPYGDQTSIKECVSLIQIASEDRIALIHIALFPGSTPEELLPADLKTIIESPDIYKVGVAIKGDFFRVEKYLGVKPRGVFELSRLHNLVANYKHNPSKTGSRKLFALAKQVQEHLLLPMYKGSVRESDWSKRLQLDQIAYAATDAYASLRIYDALEQKRMALRPIPPRPDVCDHDSAPRPQTTLRSKPVRKAAEVPEIEKEEAVQEVHEPAELSEDAASAYETAAEDLVDSHELEDSSESELSGTGTAASLDPDAGYVPPSIDRAQVEDRLENTPLVTRRSRRVGRVKLAALTDPDSGSPNSPAASRKGKQSQSAAGFFSQSPPEGRIQEDHDAAADGEPKLRATASSPPSRPDSEDLHRHLPTSDIEMSAKSDSKTLSRSHFQQNEDDRAALADSYSAPGKTHDNAGDITYPTLSSSASGPAPPTSASSSLEPSIKAPRQRKPKSTEASSISSPPETPTTSASASTPSTSKPLQPEPPPKSVEYTAAESWAQTYLHDSIPPANAASSSNFRPRIHATMAHLRAYHLWHHQHMSIGDISRLLRDPPLAESTVCNYILQAIWLERLEYRRDDIREVLRMLPGALRATRWKFFCEKVGGI